MEEWGFSVPLGTHTLVAIATTHHQNLPPPHGFCTLNGLPRSQCLVDAKRDALEAKCGCKNVDLETGEGRLEGTSIWSGDGGSGNGNDGGGDRGGGRDNDGVGGGKREKDLGDGEYGIEVGNGGGEDGGSGDGGGEDRGGEDGGGEPNGRIEGGVLVGGERAVCNVSQAFDCAKMENSG